MASVNQFQATPPPHTAAAHCVALRTSITTGGEPASELWPCGIMAWPDSRRLCFAIIPPMESRGRRSCNVSFPPLQLQPCRSVKICYISDFSGQKSLASSKQPGPLSLASSKQPGPGASLPKIKVEKPVVVIWTRSLSCATCSATRSPPLQFATRAPPGQRRPQAQM